jgi:hypothetical protein
MIKKLSCIILVLFCAAVVFGQSRNSSSEYNKYEVFTGYSETSVLDPSSIQNTDSADIKSFKGWNASATYNFKRFFGVKADVSGYYKDFTFKIVSPIVTNVREKASIHNFLVGIQLKDNKKSKRFSAFSHILAGVSSSKTVLESSACPLLPMCKESNIGPAIAIGGGVDIKLKKSFSIRLIQIDYNRAFFKDFGDNRLRAGFGVVFH